jgi:hypothetical protein
MPEMQLLSLVLMVALVIPIALLWLVRLAVWILPPTHNALAAFVSRHRFELAVFEAAAWLLLLVLSFTWTPHWSNWLARTFDVLLAFAAISRALSIRRTSSGTANHAVG